MSIVSGQIYIDGRLYQLNIHRTSLQPVECPRLIIVAYQPNDLARNVLGVCLQTIQHFTQESYELWVVDNNSPLEQTRWLIEWPNLNVILNRTEPLPAEARSQPSNQQEHGSYANAVALELATRLIEPQTRYFMTLHMDTMPCHPGWLSFLQSKIRGKVKAAGVRLDRVRTPAGVLHVLGYMVDFQLFRELKLDFLPQLPRYDVGDWVTVALREAGYQVFACSNTLWQPELIETIPTSSPLRDLSVDRAFDDDGNVIFLHLGRAVRQSQNQVEGRKVSLEEWINFAAGMMG